MHLGHGDVRFFDAVARVYDAVMPPTDAGALRSGLGFADRPVECVLDIGGGSGRAARELAARTVVVDISAGMLRRARARGLECVRADAGRLPVADRSVDAAVCVDAFHHIPAGQRVIEEVHRALAPGGVFVVREFDPATLRGRALVAGERLLGMDSSFLGPSDLARAMERAGFAAGLLDVGFEYTVFGVKRESQ
jgi:demethylmenaquinone methyltransferase/2-methoxy-6-polyprenyl-1,4-benzoquinol methylase